MLIYPQAKGRIKRTFNEGTCFSVSPPDQNRLEIHVDVGNSKPKLWR
jgi:hypothetical protein